MIGGDGTSTTGGSRARGIRTDAARASPRSGTAPFPPASLLTKAVNRFSCDMDEVALRCCGGVGAARAAEAPGAASGLAGATLDTLDSCADGTEDTSDRSSSLSRSSSPALPPPALPPPELARLRDADDSDSLLPVLGGMASDDLLDSPLTLGLLAGLIADCGRRPPPPLPPESLRMPLMMLHLRAANEAAVTCRVCFVRPIDDAPSLSSTLDSTSDSARSSSSSSSLISAAAGVGVSLLLALLRLGNKGRRGRLGVGDYYSNCVHACAAAAAGEGGVTLLHDDASHEKVTEGSMKGGTKGSD